MQEQQSRILGTRELMPSGPVTESRVERTFSTFSGAKGTEFRSGWVRRGRMGTESEGLGTQYLKANTELRHLAWRGAYTRDGVNREPSGLEEGGQFESSFLRLDRCCFLALLREDTHLLRTFWNSLRLPSVGLVLQQEKASYSTASASPQDSMYHGSEEGLDN